MNNLQYILDTLQPISLNEMDAVTLMNRTDTKFVFHQDKLPVLIEKARGTYKVLEIESVRNFSYHSTYFDTPDFEMYINHHNGKLNRFKVRYRTYLQTGDSFFEIKIKNNKGRTKKKRIKYLNLSTIQEQEVADFLMQKSPYFSHNLEPKLIIDFDRITLVHNGMQERMTIDTNLTYKLEDGTVKTLPQITIVEIKRSSLNVLSDFMLYLREQRISPSGMSKYCIGIAAMYPHIKQNNFKPKLFMLNKISNAKHPIFVTSC